MQHSTPQVPERPSKANASVSSTDTSHMEGPDREQAEQQLRKDVSERAGTSGRQASSITHPDHDATDRDG